MTKVNCNFIYTLSYKLKWCLLDAVLKELFNYASYALCSKDPLSFLRSGLNSVLLFVRTGLGEEFINDSEVVCTCLVCLLTRKPFHDLFDAWSWCRSWRVYLYDKKLSLRACYHSLKFKWRARSVSRRRGIGRWSLSTIHKADLYSATIKPLNVWHCSMCWNKDWWWYKMESTDTSTSSSTCRPFIRWLRNCLSNSSW